MKTIYDTLPPWLRLDDPDGGTVEYLRRELFTQNDPRLREELFALIKTTESRVEDKRQKELRGKR